MPAKGTLKFRVTPAVLERSDRCPFTNAAPAEPANISRKRNGSNFPRWEEHTGLKAEAIRG
jgi:hypothetical protein